MTTNLYHYRQMLEQPWGKIQYEIAFAQLSHLENKQILDFGAGFGLTSEFLSKKNTVIAVEPNEEMLLADKTHTFKKLVGSLEVLADFPDQSFDIICCHNVLEYIAPEERPHYLAHFKRLLRTNGLLSIIKHNQVGKVIQSVVFHNDVNTALELLKGQEFNSPSFTQGSTYTINELVDMSQLELEKYLAIRSFYSLQPNEFKTQPDWLEKMTQIELAVADLTPYKDMSFLQHVWLKK